MATVTLTKRGTDKAGNTAYSRPGVRSSVYFNKLMFKPGTEAPASIEIVVPDGVLAEPGDVRVGGVSPEKAAKAIALAKKAEENAAKAKARADKALARAAKAAAKAGVQLPSEQPAEQAAAPSEVAAE